MKKKNRAYKLIVVFEVFFLFFIFLPLSGCKSLDSIISPGYPLREDEFNEEDGFNSLFVFRFTCRDYTKIFGYSAPGVLISYTKKTLAEDPEARKSRYEWGKSGTSVWCAGGGKWEENDKCNVYRGLCVVEIKAGEYNIDKIRLKYDSKTSWELQIKHKMNITKCALNYLGEIILEIHPDEPPNIILGSLRELKVSTIFDITVTPENMGKDFLELKNRFPKLHQRFKDNSIITAVY